MANQIVDDVLEWYRPSAVVLQCGADSLAGDKLGCFNITMEGHAMCVQHLRKTGLPLILLGGGGYTTKNVARAWTYETACALGIEDTIDRNLPWHDYFEWFGPRYRLEVAENNMEDCNEREGYLDRLL
jgi:histone deacetylase 1/2